MMNDLFFILIPCHNDCKKAELLKNRIWSLHPDITVIVGHNGCKLHHHDGLPWSNKARTINHFAKNCSIISHWKYMLVIDADVEIGAGTIPALREAMVCGRVFGSALILEKANGVVLDEQPDFGARYAGACWFASIKLLNRIRVPEDIVVEDTAFVTKLEKEKYNIDPIWNAVVYVESLEDNFKKKFRQQVRYSLGAYEMAKKKLSYSYIISNFILMGLMISMVFFSFFYNWKYIFVVIFIALVSSLPPRTKKKIHWSWQNLMPALSLTIIPFYAFWLFVRKQKVW